MNTVRIGTALGLAWAALAVLPAAHPQSLTLSTGDDVSVSAAGTVGTLGGTVYQAGQNKASSYTVSGGGAYAVVANSLSAFTLGSGGSLAGGYDGGGLDAEGSSAITINGGTLTAGLYGTGLNDRSLGPVTVNGGTLAGGEAGYGLASVGTGSVVVSGGTLTAGAGGIGLLVSGGAPVTVSGGTLTAGGPGTGINTGFGGAGMVDDGYGPVTISGGVFSGGKAGDGLDATFSGPITVSGGTFAAPGGTGLRAYGSILNLFSQGDTPFLIDGVPMNNVSLTGSYNFSNMGGLDTISGTLLNGDRLDTTFKSFGNAIINLNIGTPPALPVPEASTTVSFGLLLALGAGGLVIAARRRKSAV